MTDLFQYPAYAAIDPESLSVGLRDEIQWWRDLSVPTRRPKRAYPGIFIIDPQSIGDIEDTRLTWFAPLSEPMRRPERISAPPAFSIDPATLDDPLRDEVQWFRPLAEPTRRPVGIASVPSSFIDITSLGDVAVEIVTLDEFRPLSLPTLRARRAYPPPSFTTDEETLSDPLRDELQWFRGLDHPTRRPVGVDRIPSAFIDTTSLGEVGVEPEAAAVALSYPQDLLQTGSAADTFAREWNRRERAARLRRAEQAAAEAARLAQQKKSAAKRQAKKLYRAIERSPATPTAVLIDRISPFAPRLSRSLDLPPLEAIKFDMLVEDTAALRDLYLAWYELEDKINRDDEAAMAVIMLALQ